MTLRFVRSSFAAALAAVVALAPHATRAQDVRVRDLVLSDAAPPVRLMGYGIVTGLNGTGDMVSGTTGSGETVQSIVNLLRRFDISVPAALLRTRNVAAVLVTSEVSTYLRPGGRFEVEVSSLGDARSLRGGVLWMTPMVADAGGQPLAGAQGPIVISAGSSTNRSLNAVVGTTGTIPNGGVLEANLPRPQLAASNMLLLRDPDITTAARIAAAVDSVLGGKDIATVQDPGAVRLALKDTTAGLAAALAVVRDIKVRPSRAARIVIDSRDGTIVAGGDLTVGEAVVSHGGITISVGAKADSTAVPGDVRAAAGATVQTIGAAL
ncbi:MAG: flagellar basal body P-ring protein FlgI, partial [Gemmatimonadales bacterium]